MTNKGVISILLITLMALGVGCDQSVAAQHQDNIAINADGTVTPSIAAIQQTGTIYNLISDIAGTVTVHTSNAILDGNRHTVLGISLQETFNVTIKNFIIAPLKAEMVGISLSNSSNCLIMNNTIEGFESIQAMNGLLFAGIDVTRGKHNTFTQNNLVYNLFGLRLVDTSYNVIKQNNITSNPVWNYHGPYSRGIYFINASNNIIYQNCFFNSTSLVIVINSINFWDDGRFGNYWSDYKTKYPNAQENGSTGTGNTAYVIDGNNQDNHPLLKPFNITHYTIITTFPKIKVITPINQQYNESSVPLIILTDQVNWIGYSIDKQENITISGSQTLQDIPNGQHTLTIYANNSYGNMQKETVNFTVTKQPQEKPVSTTPIVATVLVVCAAAIVGGLIVYVNKRRR